MRAMTDRNKSKPLDAAAATIKPKEHKQKQTQDQDKDYSTNRQIQKVITCSPSPAGCIRSGARRSAARCPPCRSGATQQATNEVRLKNICVEGRATRKRTNDQQTKILARERNYDNEQRGPVWSRTPRGRRRSLCSRTLKCRTNLHKRHKQTRQR